MRPSETSIVLRQLKTIDPGQRWKVPGFLLLKLTCYFTPLKVAVLTTLLAFMFLILLLPPDTPIVALPLIWITTYLLTLAGPGLIEDRQPQKEREETTAHWIGEMQCRSGSRGHSGSMHMFIGGVNPMNVSIEIQSRRLITS